jgi:ABC-type glycerol-3-phosphate transport system substrate-binding protein
LPGNVTRRAALGAVALVPALLAACAGSGAQQMPAAENGETFQLAYLHTWTPQQGHGPATDALVAKFNQQTPMIQITAQSGGGGDPYYEKLTAILASGDVPDVASSKIEYLPSLVAKKAIVTPDQLAKGAYKFDKNDMVPASKDMVVYDGVTMAMPYILSNDGIVYNRTMFKQAGLDPAKPPATWADLVEVGKRLTTGSGDGQVWGLQFPRGVPAEVPWLCFLWENGGDAIDMTKRVATWNSPAGVEALQYWVDLVNKHGIGALQQPYIQPFVDSLQFGHAPAKLANSDDVLKVLADGIEAAVTQKQLPKPALDDAARIAEPLIKAG